MYLLFAGPDYDAQGGARDLLGSYPDLRTAEDALPPRVGDHTDRVGREVNWAHVLYVDPSGARVMLVAEWIANEWRGCSPDGRWFGPTAR